MVHVHFDTETPQWKGYLASIDGAEEVAVESGFEWALKPGANRVEVRPVNGAGRRGITSRMVLSDQPTTP